MNIESIIWKSAERWLAPMDRQKITNFLLDSLIKNFISTNTFIRDLRVCGFAARLLCPSQFACQTGEVKKFNPMMDVIIAWHLVMNIESIIWKSAERRLATMDRQKITNFLRKLHIVYTYKMCVKLRSVYMFKLRSAHTKNWKIIVFIQLFMKDIFFSYQRKTPFIDFHIKWFIAQTNFN